MKCLLCDKPVPIVKGVIRGSVCEAHYSMLNNQTIPRKLTELFLADEAAREPFRQHMAALSRGTRKGTGRDPLAVDNESEI